MLYTLYISYIQGVHFTLNEYLDILCNFLNTCRETKSQLNGICTEKYIALVYQLQGHLQK